MTKNVVKSSGNVFADLGVRSPDEALIKAELAKAISHLIDAKGLTQAEAAQILGVDQPKVSSLVRGKLRGFSLDRLIRFLTALGSDVEIVIKDGALRSQKPGLMTVAAH